MRGPLTDEQCDDVKKSVIEMFEECRIDSYPIDPYLIAERLCYVLRRYSDLSFEKQVEAFDISDDSYSKVEYNDETGMYQYVIYYNDIGRSERRIRWSLFHEIGHCYRGHHDNPDDSLHVIEEAEANLFAKYAIAPPPLIHVLKLSSSDDVARIFVTTEDAAYNSYCYYRKWVQYGPMEYTDFERQLLRLFKIAA